MIKFWINQEFSVEGLRAWQSNPPISQFNSPCNEFTSVWSLCVYNITMWHTASSKLQTKHDEISNSLQKEHLIEVVSVISWNTDVSTDTIVIRQYISVSLSVCIRHISTDVSASCHRWILSLPRRLYYLNSRSGAAAQFNICILCMHHNRTTQHDSNVLIRNKSSYSHKQHQRRTELNPDMPCCRLIRLCNILVILVNPLIYHICSTSFKHAYI